MKSSKYNERFYSTIFRFRDKTSSYYKTQSDKINKVLGAFDNHPSGRILDIGCGDGYISSLIAKKTGAEIYGVDVSGFAVKLAEKRGVKAMRVDVDGKKLPYRDDYFDAVFCGDVIEHVFYSDVLLDNVHRVLKPGGYVIISIPNIASWYNRLFLLLGIMPSWVESSSVYTGNPFIKKGSGHIRAFTKRSLVGLLRFAGFRINDIKGCPVIGNGEYSDRKECIWNKIDGLFAMFPSLASTIIVKAYKPEKK